MAEVVLEPLASAAAVLSLDEREIGVALIDIGGGTTDVIIYVDGAVVHTSVIPIGGINLTNDVASGLRTPVAEAERIKIKYGCARPRMVDDDETIEVPSVGGRGPRVLPRRVLAEIIEPRVEEIFQRRAATCIHESGYVDMLAVGRGRSPAAPRCSTACPRWPSRSSACRCVAARPQGVGGLVDVVKSPAYATGVGLVKYGAEQLRQTRIDAGRRRCRAPVRRGVGGRIGQWFREVF